MGMIVVHFDQQTGAPHAICWSFVSALKQVFLSFPSLTEKERKKKRNHKFNTKNIPKKEKTDGKSWKSCFCNGKSSYNTHKMLSKLQLERKVWVASDKL